MSLEVETKKSLLRSKLMLIPVAIVLYLVLLYFVFRPFESGSAWLILDANSVILALVGALVFAIVAHRFGWLSTKSGQISVFILIGLVLWTFAEITNTSLQVALGGATPAFPGPADFFWIVAYIAFAIALIMNVRAIHVKLKLSMLALWIALSLVTTLVIIVVDVLPLAQVVVNPGDIIGVVYPIEDLVIVVLALVIVLKFRAGEVARAWGLLVLGFVIEAVGDILYWYEQAAGIYSVTTAYDIADLFLSFGYVAILASGLAFISTFGARGGRKSA